MKRLVALIMILVMTLSTSAFVFADEIVDTGRTQTIELSGFSYDIQGKSIDETNNYNMEFEYEVSYGNAEVKIPKIEGVTEAELETTLDEVAENTYSKTFDNGMCITLELIEGHGPILDIIQGDRVYAFGGDRREKVYAQIEDLKAVQESSRPTIQPMAAGGTMKTAKNSKVYMKAVWNPTKSNRLAIRVNTQGSQVAASVQGISIKNGKVPSVYVVKSLNPTGANTSANFVNTLTYILNSTTFPIKLPSFSNTPVSSCSGNNFSFSVNGMSVAWDKLNSTSDSTSGTNGMLFYVFLDDNLSTKPVPSGTISIRYRISATGTFDATLDF